MAICIAFLAMWIVRMMPSRFANQSVSRVQWIANWVMVFNLLCAVCGCVASFAASFLHDINF